MGQPDFECPVCGFKGRFKSIKRSTGLRKYAQCPSCDAVERHRLQYMVLEKIFAGIDSHSMRMIHFAPETFFLEYFNGRVGVYETADLNMPGVDHNVDLQSLPFGDASYDFVFASHVLEHIPDDTKAIREIRRILTPGGIAVLPVPIVVEKTIEYTDPNPYETDHVRAPGYDYFDRYDSVFDRVERFTSDMFPEKYQLYIFEDRTCYPTPQVPLRTPMQGERHADVVPVCFVEDPDSR